MFARDVNFVWRYQAIRREIVKQLNSRLKVHQWQYWSIIIALIRVKYLLASFKQSNYCAIDSVNCMKSNDHINNDKANCNIRRSHFMYLHFQMLATSKLTHCLCSFVKLLNCCKLVCNSTLWSITLIKMCLVISQMNTNNVLIY